MLSDLPLTPMVCVDHHHVHRAVVMTPEDGVGFLDVFLDAATPATLSLLIRTWDEASVRFNREKVDELIAILSEVRERMQ